MIPDGKIPAGTLIQGRQGLTDQLSKFMLMKELDAPYEKWQGPRRHTVDTVSKTSLIQNIIKQKESRTATVPNKAAALEAQPRKESGTESDILMFGGRERSISVASVDVLKDI